MNDFLEKSSRCFGFAYGLCRTASVVGELDRCGDAFARSVLSDAEFERYAALRLPKQPVERLAGRIAAKQAIARRVDVQDDDCLKGWSVLNDEARAPYLSEFPQWTISISHSGDFAAAVLSERPIGIDLEKICGHPPALAAFFCNEKEQALLAELSGDPLEWNRLLTRFWTRKESAAKFYRVGGKLSFRNIDAAQDDLPPSDGWRGLRWLSVERDGYSLSLAVVND